MRLKETRTSGVVGGGEGSGNVIGRVLPRRARDDDRARGRSPRVGSSAKKSLDAAR